MMPNLVARKMSFLFPDLLDLVYDSQFRAAHGQQRRSKLRHHVPFTTILAVYVDIGGVPEPGPAVVHAI